MKIFNNVQELWDYCAFCPICVQNHRNIYVTIGPDTVFELRSHHKEENSLELNCAFTNKRIVYSVKYMIDCLTNSFDITVSEESIVGQFSTGKPDPDKAKRAYFYFYIQGICQTCKSSAVYGKDLELDMLSKKVVDIGLESESYFLLKEKDKMHLSLMHDRNVMLASRCYSDETKVVIEDGKSIELPLINLDLTDQAKVVNKIKTLILFS